MPRAEAASVVTELVAFLREPTRHRPRFTHGREVPEGGHHVFRFAQGKFPPGLLHDLPTHRREELREAADAFIRQVCFWEGATHYQVLCVAPGASREVIKESYHLLMALIHPDRSAAAAHPWPREWAQRANQAYEVLSDEAKRASYDASLRSSGSISPARSRPAEARGGSFGGARPTSRPKRRFAKAALALTAVVSTLLLLEAWYGEAPREYSLFQGLGRSGNGADHPRYLGSEFFRSHGAAAASISLASDSKGAPVDARPARHEVAVPQPAPSSFPTPTHSLAAAPAAASESQPESAVAVERADVVAPLPVSATKSPPVLVAHALDAGNTPGSARPTSAEIENIVARLVGYYEAGEADQLMGLLASDGGYWKTARIRQSYADFFRATRQRRLRVDTLEWKAETAALAAHAKGEATVQAQFFDETGALDRKVALELDIALRDGEAKITRLSLYPNAP
jgi:curved DNA-binding protein CbpA